MSDAASAGQPGPGPEPTDGRRPGRRARRIALLLVALVVLLAGVKAASWWTHPDSFEDTAAGGFTADARPVSSSSLTVAVTNPRIRGNGRHTVLRGARARLADGSAPASVTFWICRDAAPLVITAEPPATYCPDGRPLGDDGASPLDDSPQGGEFVVAWIRPQRPGTVRVTGAELVYSVSRWGPDRRGTELVAMDVRIPAR